MKIKEIIYPTPLEKVDNASFANIDVIVKTQNGLCFTMTVCTPLFYLWYMDKERIDYVPAGPPDIIVKELTHSAIKAALESYCEDDGYWMKLYYLSGRDDGIFSKECIGKMLEKDKACADRGTVLLSYKKW